MRVVSFRAEWVSLPFLGNLVPCPAATISEFANMKELFVSNCLVLKSSCKYMLAIGEAIVHKNK